MPELTITDKQSKKSGKSSAYSKLQRFNYRKEVVNPSEGPGESMMDRMENESIPPE